jgi:hypothetical protein
MKPSIRIVFALILIGITSWASAYEPPLCEGEITYDTGGIFCQKKQWILPIPFEVESECAFSALSSKDGSAVCPSRWSDALFQKHYLITQETREGKYGSEIQTFSVKDLGLRWSPSFKAILSLAIVLTTLLFVFYNRESPVVPRIPGRVMVVVIKTFLTFLAWIMIVVYTIELSGISTKIALLLIILLTIHNGKRHIDYAFPREKTFGDTM